jgi:Phosphatidylethanolamine-binding protein
MEIFVQLKSRSFADRAPIPSEFAFAAIHPTTHITLGTNRNPHLTWTEVADGTNSFVLVCHDYDVPSRADDVNQEDREVPASACRACAGEGGLDRHLLPQSSAAAKLMFALEVFGPHKNRYLRAKVGHGCARARKLKSISYFALTEFSELLNEFDSEGTIPNTPTGLNDRKVLLL